MKITTKILALALFLFGLVLGGYPDPTVKRSSLYFLFSYQSTSTRS